MTGPGPGVREVEWENEGKEWQVQSDHYQDSIKCNGRLGAKARSRLPIQYTVYQYEVITRRTGPHTNPP
jgi:hypothetical protein